MTTRKEDPRWLAVYGAAFVNLMTTRKYLVGTWDGFVEKCMRDAEAVADDEQKRRVVNLAKRSIVRNRELLERLAGAERADHGGAQSPSSGADDPPVTCSRERGHDGQHEGSHKVGPMSWSSTEDPAPVNCGSCHTCLDGLAKMAMMVLCITCGNKRCPKANDCKNGCSGSNLPGQPGSAYP